MASIFTYDSSPPMVSSPWSSPRTLTPCLFSQTHSCPASSRATPGLSINEAASGDDSNATVTSLVTSLEAEPQEGPTEYKEHLLLRRRRSFVHLSTRVKAATSHRGPKPLKYPHTAIPKALPSGESSLQHLGSSNQSRHTRLEQLTTQLLWRLQQSSSNHATRAVLKGGNGAIVQTSFFGLEHSRGALYEIGVADDGSFIGLAEDELEESLQNLRTMAGSLGCSVSVLRKVVVGDCQWLEGDTGGRSPRLAREKLWVAEAYIRPHAEIDYAILNKHQDENLIDVTMTSTTQQLRITLTGATTSGKSTLLGTLTTNTLDNGRGKSRLSLLKHQHEILSGMTSSVTHELMGYTTADIDPVEYQVINFASANVSSWIDIHSSCQDGRLVFFSDSAGHPRYRRTIARGLIGWKPHWTLLCMPADNLEDTTGRLGNTPPSCETLGLPFADVDLSQDHLKLCLKLGSPLVIVITKVDLASRTGLRSYLNRILSVLRSVGRQPLILPEYGGPFTNTGISKILLKDAEDMARQTGQLGEDGHLVPIVLTSAVKGIGIGSLHALLNELPIPQSVLNSSAQGRAALFDIEEVYMGKTDPTGHLDVHSIILSGIVRHGCISLGDELVLGPYHINCVLAKNPWPIGDQAPQISKSTTEGAATRCKPANEWIRFKVQSARHLRLPSRSLTIDQVGTIRVKPMSPAANKQWHSIRKGMVLTTGLPEAHCGFIAEFARKDVNPLSVGSNVVVYLSSIRAGAKIMAGLVASKAEDCQRSSASDEEEEAGFALGFDQDKDGSIRTCQLGYAEKLHITFQFIRSQEYVENGVQVLVMAGGGPGLGFSDDKNTSKSVKGATRLSGVVGRVVGIL